MATCIENVIEAFPEADRKDISALYDAMSRERKDAFLNAGGNPNKEFRARVEKMLGDYRRAVMITEIKTLQNIAKSRDLTDFVANPMFKDKAEGLRAKMAGTFKAVKNGRLSVDYDMHANTGILSELFISEIEKTPGLGDIFKSKSLDKEIMMEVHELAREGGTPGISGSAEAQAIAQAVKKLNDARLVMLNDAGAFVNKLDGYIVTRTYDPESLKKVGKEEFTKDMMEWADFDRSFKKDFHTLNAEETIGSIYDDVVDGKMAIPGASDSDQLVKIVGTPANMAKRMERGRTIHFRDAASEFEFMQKYGLRNLSEEIHSSVIKTARASALMKTFGTNPEATFEKFLKGLSEPEKKRLKNYYAEVSGATSIPGHSPMAKWLGGARKIVDMGSLGFSVLSSFPDLATRAGVLRAGGENFLSAQLKSLTSFAANLPKSQRSDVMRLTAIGADSIMGDVIDRFSSSDGAPGMFNKLHQKYFKMIGLKWWTDANMAGTAQILSAGLGMRASNSFSSLDSSFAKIMNKYGIGPVEWDIMRQAVERDGDVAMVGFNGVLSLPDAQVAKIMEAGGLDTKGRDRAGKFKREVAHKLATYFRDRSDISMNVAGARERAEVLRRGTIEDTPEGQAMRLFAQFKSYSVTMVTKFADMYRHEVVGESEGVMAKAGAIAPLLVSMTALGYLGMSARDLAKGRTPKDPFNRDVMLESMARGGMGGIYGDYLLGEFDSRHGRSALSALAGPVLGKFDDTMDLYNQLRDAGLHADPKKVKSSAMLRYLTNIFPGNMPVVRQGLDYLFLNSMAESLNPGYNKRMQARMEQVGQEQLFDGEGEF